MSGVGIANGGLPVGYDQRLDDALHDALGQGQSVSVTATAGSLTLAVNGTGAYLFDTRTVGFGPNAAKFHASPDGLMDTVTLSEAAQRSLSGDQIALDVMNAARPAGSKGEAAAQERLVAVGTGQAEAIRATVRKAVTQEAAVSTTNISDAAETTLLARAAAYQASPAAVANFRSLLAQGEQASPADRFYATYSDPQNFQMLTTYMPDAQKASFTTAFNNRTLTIGGEADLGGMTTGSTTDTDTAQGEAWSGTGYLYPPPSDNPNTILAGAGIFGYARVSWSDPPGVGS